jgi:hypothetical protein
MVGLRSWPVLSAGLLLQLLMFVGESDGYVPTNRTQLVTLDVLGDGRNQLDLELLDHHHDVDAELEEDNVIQRRYVSGSLKLAKI